MIRRFREGWKTFWFRDGSPYDLAAARIVVGLHVMWVLLSRDLPAMSGLPPALWASAPPSNLWRFLVIPGNPGFEYAVQAVLLFALVCVVLGVASRVACFVSGLLLYHLAPLEALIWTPSPVERGFEVAILALIVLGMAPCGDRWAIRPSPSRSAREGWEYRWPLVLIQVFVVQIYFFAGYAKLFFNGLPWISAENLRNWLLVFNQMDQNAVFTSLGPFIADRPILSFGTALATIVVELGFAAVLFWPVTRRVLIPLALLFHAGILFAMNIVFLNTPQLLVFVNWDWLRRWVSRRAVASG